MLVYTTSVKLLCATHRSFCSVSNILKLYISSLPSCALIINLCWLRLNQSLPTILTICKKQIKPKYGIFEQTTLKFVLELFINILTWTNNPQLKLTAAQSATNTFWLLCYNCCLSSWREAFSLQSFLIYWLSLTWLSTRALSRDTNLNISSKSAFVLFISILPWANNFQLQVTFVYLPKTSWW